MNTPAAAAWAALSAAALYTTGYLTWAWHATFTKPTHTPLDDQPAHVIDHIAKQVNP